MQRASKGYSKKQSWLIHIQYFKSRNTLPFMYLTRRDKERGGRFVLLINRRFSTTPLKEASVLLTKNR